ncbi:Jacalin-related lectin 14 [Cardamine amara subsp. amara]|uniref:Jacalin-related lectin 14 n=1 Tax=Cardamine amara subsp. amara TaxID=228776 RepID=A0ABD0ZQI5_CARAN
MGYEHGKNFSLAEKGKKIIGFHGYAEKNLISLGPYFTTISISKSECSGGIGDCYWDDGVYESIKRFVQCQHEYVDYMIFVLAYYLKNLILLQFELDYPNEFIRAVDGTFKGAPLIKRILSLVFKTSKGRISPTFGSISGTRLVLEKKGYARVGFHGWTIFYSLSAIGGYFSLLPLHPTVEQLEARGYDRGATWNN